MQELTKSHDYWANFIASLCSDGLVIEKNPTSEHSLGKAWHYLPQIGAYRFRGYYESFRPYLKDGKTVGLNDVLRLYKFDRRLRLLSLDAIERIEVSIKARLTDLFFENLGPKWLQHRDLPMFFTGRDTAHDVRRNLIESARKRYELDGSDKGIVPVAEIDPTLILEAASFGEISRLIGHLREAPKQRIASHYRLQPNVLHDWLRGLTRVRNISAHHSRLWNARFKSRPPFPAAVLSRFRNSCVEVVDGDGTPARFYSYSVVVFHLLNQIARKTAWHNRLQQLIEDHQLVPQAIPVRAEMGFPEDWAHEPFWNPRRQ